MISDFAWGTPSAQPVTLSFWAQSSLTGTFGGALCKTMLEHAPIRSRTHFPVNASTWTKIVITIPGDTAGAWVMSGNGGGGILRFDIGSGATWRAPANAWASANYLGANGSVSVVGTNAAGFGYLTGVKLEIGSVATPFNRKSLAASMADCQRYYEVGGEPDVYMSGVCLAFNTAMRAAPTLTVTNNSVQNAAAAAGVAVADVFGASYYHIANVTGSVNFDDTVIASAEL